MASPGKLTLSADERDWKPGKIAGSPEAVALGVRQTDRRRAPRRCKTLSRRRGCGCLLYPENKTRCQVSPASWPPDVTRTNPEGGDWGCWAGSLLKKVKVRLDAALPEQSVPLLPHGCHPRDFPARQSEPSSPLSPVPRPPPPSVWLSEKGSMGGRFLQYTRASDRLVPACSSE